MITYNLGVWVFVKQTDVVSGWKYVHAHVFIHPASLCLLVGAFNPYI